MFLGITKEEWIALLIAVVVGILIGLGLGYLAWGMPHSNAASTIPTSSPVPTASSVILPTTTPTLTPQASPTKLVVPTNSPRMTFTPGPSRTPVPPGIVKWWIVGRYRSADGYEQWYHAAIEVAPPGVEKRYCPDNLTYDGEDGKKHDGVLMGPEYCATFEVEPQRVF